VRNLEFLGTFRAHQAQAELIGRGLERFPVSGDLHAGLRFQVLHDEGPRALETEPSFTESARHYQELARTGAARLQGRSEAGEEAGEIGAERWSRSGVRGQAAAMCAISTSWGR
jgi:hypothetical protein